MPIYMDVHTVPGVKARDVAEAHKQDLLHQEEYGCRAMTYWVDEKRETIFCLVEAPEKSAVEEMHRKAHGLVPNKVVEVSSNIVESFLGRIYDPEDAKISDDGLKIFSDPSFRLLLVTKTNDPVLLKYNSGSEKINRLTVAGSGCDPAMADSLAACTACFTSSSSESHSEAGISAGTRYSRRAGIGSS